MPNVPSYVKAAKRKQSNKLIGPCLKPISWPLKTTTTPPHPLPHYIQNFEIKLFSTPTGH